MRSAHMLPQECIKPVVKFFSIALRGSAVVGGDDVVVDGRVPLHVLD